MRGGRREKGEGRREKGEGRREKGEGRREKGEGRREKGEGRREKGEGRREKGEGRREKGEGRREKGEGRREKGEGRRGQQKEREDVYRQGRGVGWAVCDVWGGLFLVAGCNWCHVSGKEDSERLRGFHGVVMWVHIADSTDTAAQLPADVQAGVPWMCQTHSEHTDVDAAFSSFRGSMWQRCVGKCGTKEKLSGSGTKRR